MSNKLMVYLLASMVIHSLLCLKMQHISFLMFSVFLLFGLMFHPYFARVVVCAQGLIVLHVL